DVPVSEKTGSSGRGRARVRLGRALVGAGENPGCPAHKHADCRSGDGFRGFGDSRASASEGVLEGAQIWILRKTDSPPDWSTDVRDDVSLIQLPHVHILCHASDRWKGPSFK